MLQRPVMVTFIYAALLHTQQICRAAAFGGDISVNCASSSNKQRLPAHGKLYKEGLQLHECIHLI